MDPGRGQNHHEVYTARHRGTGKTCCIKKIDKQKLANRSEAVRNIQDAELDSIQDNQIDLVKIIKLYKVLETDQFIYIIFEHLPLGSLKLHMNNERGYTAKVIPYIIRQLLYAISHVHSHNKIHRDVKLENILVDTIDPELGPRIKLANFGFAKELK